MYLSPTYLSKPSLTFFWLKTMSRKAIAFWAFGFLLMPAAAGARSERDAERGHDGARI